MQLHIKYSQMHSCATLISYQRCTAMHLKQFKRFSDECQSYPVSYVSYPVCLLSQRKRGIMESPALVCLSVCLFVTMITK